MNLVVNARDAMPGGGTLTIETANVELGHEHVDVIPGPHVVLSVTDTGLGMTAEVRDRLFEPFFTTKDAGRGTGLGLSMVQAIVRQSGGHIIVDSAAEPGHDVQGLLSAPGRRRRRAGAARSPPSQAIVRGEGIVLLAEDDRSVRRLVVAELTRRGFTVLEAEDGAAALEMFRKEKDRIDVLVTDVVMPRMNGADLAKAAERIRPGLKILFISGHPERAGAGPRSDRRHEPADEAVHRRYARGPHQGTAHRKERGRWLERLKRPRSRRALGKWDLTAIGVNQVIGSAIFLLPSDVAKQVGPWGPLAFMAVGLLSLSIALCFAEAGSRFETTGGPYLPARAAFGRFIGFEVGWMMWFARVTSQASVVNGLTLALAFYWPALAAGMPRAATITGADARADLDQRPRHQAVVVGRQRADDRQAPAAGDLHHRRHLVHRSVALRDHAGRSAASRSPRRRSC